MVMVIRERSKRFQVYSVAIMTLGFSWGRRGDEDCQGVSCPGVGQALESRPQGEL